MKIDKKDNQKRVRRSLKELANNSDMMKILLEQSAVVTITDHHGRIMYVNDKFCESSKYSREELLGENHRILNSAYHPREFFTNLWKTIKAGKVWRGEIRNKAKDGSLYWVNTTIIPFFDDIGRVTQFASFRYDVTHEKFIEENLSSSREKYRLITENMSDLITIINREGRILYVTPSSKEMVGLKPDELEQTDLLSWVHKDDGLNLKDLIEAILMEKQRATDIEFQMMKRDGTYLDVEAKINPILDESAKEINELLLVMRDISFRKQSEQLIHQLTHYDILTGLANRGFFMQRLSKELYQNKTAEAKMAIIYFDLDRFKDINESKGHEAGDSVLVETANRLKIYMGSEAFVARIGGDEFAVLVKNVDEEEVLQTAQYLLQKVHEPIKLSRDYHRITASIGIALYPNNGENAEELMKRANIASDTVKMQGKNNVLLFNPAMEEVSLERILLENEIKKAIENNHFTIDYQPKFDLYSSEVIGMEALVRWIHPELGRISPGKFIPVAEEANLINEIGEVILRKGCIQNKKWQDEGYNPLRLSVNLSAKQFYQENLVSKMKEILQETELDPEWLEIEVTESAFTDIDHARVVLQQIRNLGITVSIDDFGTGYSSFSYLKHFPVDILKIDRIFIQDIGMNVESKAIVQGIKEIAESLDLEIIAEGIETEEQLTILKEIGLKQGQGFLFSKAVSRKEFSQFLERTLKEPKHHDNKTNHKFY